MEWCRFYITNISEVEWTSNSLDSLILPDDQKKILRASVSSHESTPISSNQSQQKGKGLVVLLYGSPGSGKTLTAESSAEVTRKALLSASMGELNKYNSPYYFERSLKRLLRFATIWGAIVLLDEADVFLEAREDGGGDAAKRNALVAGKSISSPPRSVYKLTNWTSIFEKPRILFWHNIFDVEPCWGFRWGYDISHPSGHRILTSST